MRSILVPTVGLLATQVSNLPDLTLWIKTRNHQVWGPLALYSASPEALLKAKTGKFEYLTTGPPPGRKTWVGRAAEPGP